MNKMGVNMQEKYFLHQKGREGNKPEARTVTDKSRWRQQA
jgi:hypothetical protein